MALGVPGDLGAGNGVGRAGGGSSLSRIARSILMRGDSRQRGFVGIVKIGRHLRRSLAFLFPFLDE
jgi:hypothetical protein